MFGWRRQPRSDEKPPQIAGQYCSSCGAGSAPISAAPASNRRAINDELAIVASEEQAQLLLDWLRKPGGRIGWITVRDLRRMHLECCAEQAIDPVSWLAIARRLGKILPPQPKRYLGPKRLRAWFVPAHDTPSASIRRIA